MSFLVSASASQGLNCAWRHLTSLTLELPKNRKKSTKENSEHYYWGDQCSGWHLVKSNDLSIIEELMPPNTKEQKHHHKKAQQFFRILKGIATFEIENSIVTVKS